MGLLRRNLLIIVHSLLFNLYSWLIWTPIGLFVNAIAFNAANTVVETALEALTQVNTLYGNGVTVDYSTGSSLCTSGGSNYASITFTQALGDVPVMTADVSALTGTIFFLFLFYSLLCLFYCVYQVHTLSLTFVFNFLFDFFVLLFFYFFSTFFLLFFYFFLFYATNNTQVEEKKNKKHKDLNFMNN